MRNFRQLAKDFVNDRKIHGKNLIFVEADPKKGFNYSFYLYIPPVASKDEMKSSILMDCLNNYEDDLLAGEVENPKIVEMLIKKLYEKNIVVRAGEDLEYIDNDIKDVHSKDKANNKIENFFKSLKRMVNRMENALAPINRFSHIKGFPVIVPIIPGFMGSNIEAVNQVKSQLDKDVIEDLAPQIRAMYEYASIKIEKITEERYGKNNRVKMQGIINFGYSKSSDFASNFMAYYPELCKGGFFGCGSLGTLPLDSITLKIVENKSDSFYKGENGEIIKEVTQEEFDRISKEYNKEKREHQKDIVEVEKKRTYIVPLNFPLGIADIEHYRKLSELDEKDEAGNVVKSGKEVYRNLLKNIPKKIFVSEYEESHTGTYAYLDTCGGDGKIITKAGTNMEEELKKNGIDCPTDWIEFQKKLADNNFGNVELAGMSNRILESVDFVNAVLGRGVNDRFQSYKQLYELLGAKVQTKIYKGYNHYHAPFCTMGGKKVFPSLSLLDNREGFQRDVTNAFNLFAKGEVPELSKEGAADQVSPVYQLLRRYLANGGNIQSLFGLEEDVLNSMFNALAKDKLIKFDEFTKDDIEGVIKRARENLQINGDSKDVSAGKTKFTPDEVYRATRNVLLTAKNKAGRVVAGAIKAIGDRFLD